MNAMRSLRSVRWLTLLLLGLGCLHLFASSALAGEASSSLFLPASLMLELMADRARLIQVSLVIVALGCAVMWWYK